MRAFVLIKTQARKRVKRLIRIIETGAKIAFDAGQEITLGSERVRLDCVVHRRFKSIDLQAYGSRVRTIGIASVPPLRIRKSHKPFP